MSAIKDQLIRNQEQIDDRDYGYYKEQQVNERMKEWLKGSPYYYVIK